MKIRIICKKTLAFTLSFLMAFSGSPEGITAFAAGSGVPAAATASNAEKASASDAELRDEDGFLTDGTVMDDIVTADTIETEIPVEPEMTGKINKALAGTVRITVIPDIATVAVGGKFTFQCLADPSSILSDTSWWCSDPSVASIDSNGTVTGLKPGTTDIYVKAGGYMAAAELTVTEGGVPVTSLVINTASRKMYTCQTFQLKAWPQPANAADRSVTWKSSNPSVATVNGNGLVTAVNDGTATITVKTKDGGFTQTCTITVKSVTSLKLNTEACIVDKGKTFQLKAWPQPVDAADRSVTWKSSNTSIATVNKNGLVIGVATGSATITAKTVDGGFMKTCKVTVGEPVTSVKINTSARTVNKGESFQLKAWPQPATAANKAVTWSSSNSAVATVSSTGLVKAVKAGTATITVKTVSGGFTQSCRITVPGTIPVTSVKINSTAKTIEPGKTFQLAAWPQPSNATNKAVTWSSSNTAVATVTSTGLVKAVKAGTATITVRTKDGGFTQTCRITAVAVTSVAISQTSMTLIPNGMLQLKAWPQPVNAPDRSVTWSSSNTAVAKVSANGLVTAVKRGTATITAKSVNGKTAVCRITVVAN